MNVDQAIALLEEKGEEAWPEIVENLVKLIRHIPLNFSTHDELVIFWIDGELDWGDASGYIETHFSIDKLPAVQIVNLLKPFNKLKEYA